MSPDAIVGEGGAYVPCLELPATDPVVPAGAIVGSGVAFVARDELAAVEPTVPSGAIRGSGVGFVAKPCDEGCVDGRFIKIIDNFDRVEATVWGTATGPDYDIGTPADAWNKTTIFGPSTESVDGDYGIVNNPGGAATVVDETLDIPNAWFVGLDWMECRWLVKTTIGNQQWSLQNASGTTTAWWNVKLDGSGMQFGRFQGGINDFNILNGAPINLTDDPFWIALRLDWLASTIECKRWADGDAEPGAWESSLGGMALTSAALANIRFRSGQTGPAGAYSTDYIEATVPC